MEYRDYYKTLGVARTATTAEIKKAYRRLARELHPDRNPGDSTAERRFKEVNEANAVLSDPKKREQYDALGADWERYAQAGARPGADPFGPGGPFAGFRQGGAAGPGGVRFEFHGTDAGGFSDFFRMFFGGDAGGRQAAARDGATQRRGRVAEAEGFDDLFSRLRTEASAGTAGTAPGAGGAGHRAGGGPGRDETAVDVEIGLEEAFHGTARLVQVDGRRLEVQVPRGVETGSRIRLRGKGGGSGEHARDLVLVTRVRPHPVFSRTGADLSRELPVTLREALLGAQVEVATLKGRVLLTLPAGTQPGQTFRLTGQGMPRLKGTGSGDLFVKVKVVLPAHLDDESRRLAEAFLDHLLQPDPRAGTGTS